MATEKLIRMINYGGVLYFRQDDLCDIVSAMEKKAGSLNAKSQLTELLEILNCSTDTEDRMTEIT